MNGPHLAVDSRPAVAAELRRIADHFETQTVPGTVLPEPRTLQMVVTRLHARADELDPPAKPPACPDHWAPGPDGTRISIPEFGCAACAGYSADSPARQDRG